MSATRSLHLIDLENLCGSGLPTDDVIATVWNTYRYGVPAAPDDHYIVGVSHLCAQRAWFILPSQGVQRRVRSGKDGGELAILVDLDLGHAVGRYGRLVIGSGDGVFTPTARAAREQGLHVHQVSGVGTCARSLSQSAHTHSRLRLNELEPAGHHRSTPASFAA